MLARPVSAGLARQFLHVVDDDRRRVAHDRERFARWLANCAGGRNLWRSDRLTLFNDGPRVWIEGATPA